MRLFNRTCEVSVGPKTGVGDFVTVDQRFRIAFEVKKDKKPKSNSTIITIYNLSENTRSKITQEDNIAILKAGYGGINKLLSQGNIKDVSFKYDSTELLTMIEVLDRLPDPKEKIINISYQKNRPVLDFLTQLINQSDLVANILPGTGEGITWQRGGAFSGSVAKGFDFAVGRIDAVWSISNGIVTVGPKGVPINNSVPLLKNTTGLLNAQKTLRDKKIGFNVKALLNTEILPGSKVSIESVNVKGILECDNVVHKGDTRGPEWTTSGEFFQ